MGGVLACLAISGRAQIIPIPGDYGPFIRIISPADHQVFCGPMDIPIFAFVDAFAHASNVEFYADGTDLGPGYNLATSINPPGGIQPDIFWGPPIFRLNTVYGFYWTNVTVGPHVLTAVFKGYITGGIADWAMSITRTSAPVNILVLSETNTTTGTSRGQHRGTGSDCRGGN